MNEVTRILSALQHGDRGAAAEQLLPLVYNELRKLAASRLAREFPGQTLQATSLVHEAYLRLVDAEVDKGAEPHWHGRGHFFAAAAEAMRRILVERARRRKRLRHGGGRKRVDLNALVDLSPAAEPGTLSSPDELLALDAAVARLAAEAPDAAELVKLRYFAGLTIQQSADALGISVRTANRHWAFAKAWLYLELTNGGKAGR
jgi:RNA polymerase sigma factor (TIGR02999 family)